MKNLALILIILFAAGLQAYCQEDNPDSTKSRIYLEPYYRNVIKFNPTPMLLFGELKNITFSYERMLKKNQSFAVQAGYLQFPNVINDTVANLILINEGSKKGVNLGVDYRYYPVNRNPKPFPDGLYIGGYVSYYGFQFSNSFDVLKINTDQENTIDGNLNIVNMGFDLGYQFVFWKRLTLDLLLFGPALSYNHARLEIKGDLDSEEIQNIDEELVEKLIDRFPLLGVLHSGESLVFTGNKTKFGTGFRYSFQIGFHF
ncbi:MAG TPA: DUF3575 domain-containing protein [Bacteroidales bacterium]|nr:DUF3575 domain-containing protein [Bacteroidales bacterium]HNS46177.1 DUF3575 domain-containing protein [Bacteroidales bacterium]